MAKAWFKFFPANFVEATYSWKPSVAGIYIRLLIHQFSHGFIPKETEELLQISNCSIQEWNEAWKKLSKKFQLNEAGNGYINLRMESTKTESESSYQRRAAAADKSHESRRRNKDKLQSNNNANCNANASASGSGSSSGSLNSYSSKVAKVFDYYRTHHPQARLGADIRKKIGARLKEGFTVDECKKAIDGCHLSDYHSGKNESGTKYQSCELIFRNSAKTNQFIEMVKSRNTESAYQPRSQREIAS